MITNFTATTTTTPNNNNNNNNPNISLTLLILIIQPVRLPNTTAATKSNRNCEY